MARFPVSDMRASDSDRDAVLTELSEHFQAGRLTSAEFDERSSKALQARTFADLAALTTDLPDTTAQPVPEPAAGPLPGPVPGPAGPVLRRGGSPLRPLVAAVAVGLVIWLLADKANLGAVNGLWWLVIVAAVVARRGMHRR